MSYQHPDDVNLKNLHKSMEYNGLGQPVIRTLTNLSSHPSEGNTMATMDAFGRLRTGQPYTLFDSSFRYADTDKWNSSTATGGSASFTANIAAVSMSVSGSNGSSVIRETKTVFPYQPGKSLLILNTFVMATPRTGLRQRVGYFGAKDGVYFMSDDLAKYFVIRKNTSGVVDDTTEKVSQTNWNIDTLDGTGPSGITLDVTKTQIFWCDLEWLGVGSVRCGFVINGVFVTCHIFHHANINTDVYMSTACLPVRFEITNTGNTGVVSTMKQICTSVMSEGGYEATSTIYSIGTALSGVSVDTSWVSLVSIRLKSGYQDAIVIPAEVDVLNISNADSEWALFKNVTTANALSSWNSASSFVEYSLTSEVITNTGTRITGSYVAGKSTPVALNGQGGYAFPAQLGRTIAGVSDVITLATRAAAASKTMAGRLGWFELS